MITPNSGRDHPLSYSVVLRCSCWEGSYKTTPEGGLNPAAPPGENKSRFWKVIMENESYLYDVEGVCVYGCCVSMCV